MTYFKQIYNGLSVLFRYTLYILFPLYCYWFIGRITWVYDYKPRVFIIFQLNLYSLLLLFFRQYLSYKWLSC